MIHILLTSDLHLGKPENQFPLRAKDRSTTLRRIMSIAQNHDIVLFAGDLFDSPNPSKESMEELRSLVSIIRKRGSAVVGIPGFADGTDSEKSFYGSLGFDRSFVDGNTEDPFVFSKAGESVYIYGIPPYQNDKIQEIKKISSDGFHVGLFHAKVGSSDADSVEEGLIPPSKIKDLGLDFCALGHNHSFRLYKYLNRIVAAYAGTPESTDYKESGNRYVLSLTVENNKISQVKRMTVNSVQVHESFFDCTGKSADALHSFIKDAGESKTISRITITGRRGFLLNEQMIGRLAEKFYSLSILDLSHESARLIADRYSAENSLRGDFFTLLAERLSTGRIPRDISPDDLADILGNIASANNKMEEKLCALLTV